MKILLGFLDPTEGSVLIDGLPLAKLIFFVTIVVSLVLFFNLLNYLLEVFMTLFVPVEHIPMIKFGILSKSVP